MQIQVLPVGPLQANCYFISKGEEMILIDPGEEVEKIEHVIGDKKIVGILVTHYHFDHVGALDYFLNKYGLKANDKIKNFNYEILSTPGHSKDSLTFYFPKENVMFTGDFLFKGTIGRMDLEGGDEGEMRESLKQIFTYSSTIKIYPGHGSSSFLGDEKKWYF